MTISPINPSGPSDTPATMRDIHSVRKDVLAVSDRVKYLEELVTDMLTIVRGDRLRAEVLELRTRIERIESVLLTYVGDVGGTT